AQLQFGGRTLCAMRTDSIEPLLREGEPGWSFCCRGHAIPRVACPEQVVRCRQCAAPAVTGWEKRSGPKPSWDHGAAEASADFLRSGSIVVEAMLEVGNHAKNLIEA